MAKQQRQEVAAGMSPTQILAEYIAGLSYRNIPHEVVAHIKLCIIDSLGCALFGSTLSWGKIITSFTKEMGKGKERSSGVMARFPAPTPARQRHAYSQL